MPMLTGSQAAMFADLAYDTASATDVSSATWRAQGSLAAQQKKTARGCAEEAQTPLNGFSAVSGLVGQSGVFALKETSGFGAVFERKTPQGKELVVAFRGTQSAGDYLSNFNIGMEAGPGGSIVHAGFNRVYQTLQDEVRKLIRDARPAALHFVGHSLGGALATLAMADHGQQSGTRDCHLYTFGAPRVGGFGLGSQLRGVLAPDRVRRVYSVSDPVPMLPLLPYQHFAPGATGLNMGYAFITARAHDRIQYRDQMPAHGWPAPLPLPVKSDPAYWLGMAERAQGFSAAGYMALSMALSAILRVMNLSGVVMSFSATVLDRLIGAIEQAMALSVHMAEVTLRFVKAALRLVGRGAMTTAITAADLTREFLRFVFEMLYAPVRNAAGMALVRAG